MLVFGPLPGPITIVEVDTPGGGIGCNQVILVNAVVDVPVASKVGL